MRRKISKSYLESCPIPPAQPVLRPNSIPDPVTFAAATLGFHPDPHQCRILQSTSPRVILNCCRQWGKSTVTAARAVHHAFHYPASLTLVLTPSERQSSEFLQKAVRFLQKLDIKPRGDGHNQISLLFPNDSRIIGLPANEDTIRGFSSVSLLLIDEASRVKESLYKSARPMLAASGGGLWLLSTPNGPRGFFYETWTTAAPEWCRIAIPATECPRIAKPFLDEERAVLGERWFRQEYLCEFLESDDAVFSRAAIEDALCDDIEPFFIP